MCILYTVYGHTNGGSQHVTNITTLSPGLYPRNTVGHSGESAGMIHVLLQMNWPVCTPSNLKREGWCAKVSFDGRNAPRLSRNCWASGGCAQSRQYGEGGSGRLGMDKAFVNQVWLKDVVVVSLADDCVWSCGQQASCSFLV